MSDRYLDAAGIAPLSYTEVIELERAELARFVALLRALPPEAWTRPARSSGGSIHAVAAHVAGTYSAQGSLRQLGRQIDPRVHQVYRVPGDSYRQTLTRLQIGDRMYRQPEEIISEIESSGERAIRFRAMLLRPLHRVSMEQLSRPRPVIRNWSAHTPLLDLWFHRLEIGEAGGLPFEATADHDLSIFESRLRVANRIVAPAFGLKRIDFSIGGLPSAFYQFGEGDSSSASIEIKPVTLAKLIAGWHSPAAARERSIVQGDVKAIMTLLFALSPDS